MDINFSNELKEVLSQSHQEAIRHNNKVITPAHLLLALMSASDDRPFKLIERASSADTSAYELKQALDTRLFESSLDNGDGTPVSPSEVSVSDVTSRILKLSALESRMLKSGVVLPEHLLLAIFHNSETQETDFMKQFHKAGVNYQSLVRQLNGTASENVALQAGFSDDDDDDDGDDMPYESENKASSESASSKTAAKQSSNRRNTTDTPALDKFGYDMTRAAEENRLDPVVGRETEIERLATGC